MIENQVIALVAGVPGVEVRHVSSPWAGTVHVRLKHTFWSWFWPGLRRRRRCFAQEVIDAICPTGVEVLILTRRNHG